jgi:hypothetical protein
MDAPVEEIHQPSMTALAAEALRTGTSGLPAAPEAEIPQEDELLRLGDPNVDPLENAYVGDEAPGGDMPTPDQDLIDDIGRAYGLAEEDDGELRSAAEILERRDQRRSE